VLYSDQWTLSKRSLPASSTHTMLRADFPPSILGSSVRTVHASVQTDLTSISRTHGRAKSGRMTMMSTAVQYLRNELSRQSIRAPEALRMVQLSIPKVAYGRHWSTAEKSFVTHRRERSIEYSKCRCSKRPVLLSAALSWTSCM